MRALLSAQIWEDGFCTQCFLSPVLCFGVKLILFVLHHLRTMLLVLRSCDFTLCDVCNKLVLTTDLKNISSKMARECSDAHIGGPVTPGAPQHLGVLVFFISAILASVWCPTMV
jgi:hypothetical protein